MAEGMKAVILAGGLGTRISEETSVKPKPMVDIGGMPILWHIMKIYYSHGVTDFVVCLGYKGHIIKEFFQTYAMRKSSVRFDLSNDTMTLLDGQHEPWTITLVETGADTMTGGRLKRVAKYLDTGAFYLTYGDGVSDVDIGALTECHKKQGGLVTLTAVQPPGRFGSLLLEKDSNTIDRFHEKKDGDGAWVNGGFFMVEPEAIDYIDGDDISWEKEPLQNIALDGKLKAYRHSGFWQPMDTIRDRSVLENLWAEGKAPWKTW